MSQTWNAEHYDSKIGFVSQLGKGMIALLQPQPGERILDLGCGTGDLAYEIAQSGAAVVGFDFSREMVEKARAKYPDITFQVENGETFRTDETFDAIFSNAALHWMKQPEKVIESAALALKEGGRFVAEFGGKGNVGQIVAAIERALTDSGVDDFAARNPWYFPSVGEYASLLEKHGFRVTYAEHYDRPTRLEDGENGLRHWLTAFAGTLLADMKEGQAAPIIRQIEDLVRDSLFHDGQWNADYKRLRIVAYKQNKSS